MGLNNMRLGVKIGMGLGIILLLLAMITAIAIVQLNSLSVEIAGINNKENEKLELAYQLIDQSKDLINAGKSMALADAINRPQYPPIIREMENEYELTLDKLTNQSVTLKSKQLCARIKQREAASWKLTQKLIDMLLETGGIVDTAIKKKYVEIDLHQDLLIANVQALLELHKEEKARAVSDAQRRYLIKASIWMLSLGALALIFGAVVTYFLTNSIVKPINRVADGLFDAAGQVASASAQVSRSSQSLAKDAIAQAARLDDTSASMHKMASMTRSNADNANQANALIQDTKKVVEETDRAMSELNASMKEITEASEETGNIIRTIDEIACQTNMLAQDAADVAIRAGEFGDKFAVVADEVRALAMRTEDAAKITAELIENTVKKTKTGLTIVDKTSQSFKQVAEGSRKVTLLVDEITNSSNEQARGIEQINRAVLEIDQIVQQNAANAEGSAAASERMTAQARQMKQFVDQLIRVIGGRKGEPALNGDSLSKSEMPQDEDRGKTKTRS